MIVQELHKIQDRLGCLPEAELRRLSDQIGTPLYRLQEVASSFPHFRFDPPAKVEVHVCRDMACHIRGSEALTAELQAQAAKLPAGQMNVCGVSCLGQCDRAPAAVIGHHSFFSATTKDIQHAVERLLKDEKLEHSHHYPLCGQPASEWKIDIYKGQPKYDAVRRFIADSDAERVLNDLKVSDLRGMGGAGVPATQKWRDVREAVGSEKFIVCNGDESEPGTFKDRELLLQTPWLVLEGVILAGLITGATRGYIYIRHEYQDQIAVMRDCIAKAEAMGACGNRVFGTERSFPVEVFVSPGGYICGEQSALIEAMEDRRAEPRNKPPELLTNGLYDKPTLVSNVETFAWAPSIAVKGGQWYADGGINGCKGMRLFSISGDLKNPGVFEVPNGLPLGDLIYKLAGGMVDSRYPLKAVATSGPSGGFLPAKIPVSTLPRGYEKRLSEAFVKQHLPPGATHLDVGALELDLQRFRDVNLMLGAGLVVYDSRRDMAQEALNCSQFFRNESCGKCVPCRLGSQKLVEIGERLIEKKYTRDEFKPTGELVNELSRTMEITSICGLGAVASSPMKMLLTHFQEDAEKYFAGNGKK